MRQAHSAIKGFLYQFDKSLYEILASSDGQTITLEGQIEDIDITSESDKLTIQCKYHEDKDFTISNVAEPVLDMFSHFVKQQAIGYKTKYVLYAYFYKNIDVLEQSALDEFIKKTTNKEILVKYFPQIFNISNPAILELANKPKKTTGDKKQIESYFKSKDFEYEYKMPLGDFFKCFEYRKAEKHDVLKSHIIKQLQEIDADNAIGLYYPNAFVKIATMSTLPDENERKITKSELLNWLSEQKALLVNKWMFRIENRAKVLKSQRKHLVSLFDNNSHIRAFIFSQSFLKHNEESIASFFIEYVKKYNHKKKLQKPPIFIFGNDDVEYMNRIIKLLFSYQITVNKGCVVGEEFIDDCFVNNINCPSDFSLKITMAQNITVELLKRCEVNFLFQIGNFVELITDSCFRTEALGISTISELRYLVRLDTTLMEGTK